MIKSSLGLVCFFLKVLIPAGLLILSAVFPGHATVPEPFQRPDTRIASTVSPVSPRSVIRANDLANMPRILSISPAEITQGRSGSLLISGQHLTSSMQVVLGNSITTNAPVLLNDSTTVATLQVMVSPSAAPGARPVIIQHNNRQVTQNARITVLSSYQAPTPAPPAVIRPAAPPAAPPTPPAPGLPPPRVEKKALPELSIMNPDRWYPGNEYEIIIQGRDLTTDTKIDFGKDIRIKKLTLQNPARVKATIVVDPDARPGRRTLQFRKDPDVQWTASGLGGMVLETVKPVSSTTRLKPAIIPLDRVESTKGETVPHTPISGIVTGIMTEKEALDYGFEWRGTTITGYTGSKKDIVIPSKIDDIIIKAIWDKAFYEKQLTSVKLPDTLEVIGKYAFGGAFSPNQLTTVNIPNSVTTIGEGAFINNKLTIVSIPNSVTTIAYRAFYDNKLTSVKIPDSVTTIGEGAFSSNQLTWIEIPNSIKIIERNVFRSNKISHLIMPDSVTTIEENAFLANKLTSVMIPDSVTTIGEGAFGANLLTTVSIPNSVTTIEKSAFSGNKLTSVMIPNSVKFIRASAFRSNQLTQVTIPNSVITIEKYAFYYNKLTSLTIPNSVTTIGSSAFGNNYLTTVAIPNSVKTIGSGAFDANRLTTVSIPDSVTTIEASAFSRNELTSVTIPNSVKTIGSGAFSRNFYLTSVTIPNSVTTIAYRAFYNNKLTSVKIPDSVTTIGEEAFSENGPGWNSQSIITKPYGGVWKLIGNSTAWTKQ